MEETQGPSLTSVETYFASGMEQIFSYESKEESNARLLVQGPIPLFSEIICLFYQKITKCPCSHVLLTKRSRTSDIRSFLTKVPRIIDSDPVFHINRPVLDVLDTMPFVTREEKIRNECDRKKKRRI